MREPIAIMSDDDISGSVADFEGGVADSGAFAVGFCEKGTAGSNLGAVGLAVFVGGRAAGGISACREASEALFVATWFF
jgi:hypothetical protein